MGALVAPPGWPAELRPPDAPEWERTTASWLLDLCPHDYRRYAGLRRHLVVLARFAVSTRVGGVHVFASVALSDARGWLLMQERDEHAPVAPDLWCFPGGGLEPGEDFAAAAVRELAEETGVGLSEPLHDLGTVSFFSSQCGDVDEFGLFTAVTDLTDDDVECHEGRQMVFVDPATITDLPLVDAAREALPLVLASVPYSEAFGDSREA